MLDLIKTLRSLLCIAGGIALLVYGAVCLLGVDDFIFGRGTPGARDSFGVPLLLILLGGTSVMYGLFELVDD